MKQNSNIENKEIMSTSDLCKVLGFIVSVNYLHKIGCQEAFATSTGTFWLKTDIKIIISKIMEDLYYLHGLSPNDIFNQANNHD